MSKRGPKKEEPKLNAHDAACELKNQPGHFVSVKPKEEQGYLYRECRRHVQNDSARRQ